MKQIKTASFGTGFVGRVHLDAVRRLESVVAAAIVDTNSNLAQRLAVGFAIPMAADYRTILHDPTIDAVHICTPNAQPFSMAKQALEAGKHVVCEKPLATSLEEAEELVALATQKGLRNCVCYGLRYYPMVQQLRCMPKAGGPSRAMADIGSHWFDMAEYVTGLRTTSLCADLQTFHVKRKQPKHSIETFANKMLGPEDYIETAVDT